MATKSEVDMAISTMAFLPNSPLAGASKDIISGIMQTFYMQLKDFSNSTLQAAVLHYTSANKFFPAPGDLREAAMELMLIAQDVPSPAEAWAMVVDAKEVMEKVRCDDAVRIMNDMDIANGANDGSGYLAALTEYKEHFRKCDLCTDGKSEFKYQHPVVTEAVRLMGGREAIFTDNNTADRARFTDAYKELIAREKRKNNMLPEVRGYVKQLEMDTAVGLLTDKLSKG